MIDERFFKSRGQVRLQEIAEICGAQLHNSDYANNIISSVASLEEAESNDLAFVANSKYNFWLEKTKAGACIIPSNLAKSAPDHLPILLSENPYYSFALAAQHLYPNNYSNGEISEHAHIAKSATLGLNTTIEAGVFIGENVKIGDGTIIRAGSYIANNVVIGNNGIINNDISIQYAIIGDNVILHPGVRIGQDGFGFATHNGKHVKVPQLGKVVIGNDVEIGANSCIDRGSVNDTVIGDGCQIDNLVQIGHNVRLGRGCVIAAMSGISGSTKCGDYVVIGGQAGFAGHLHIGSFSKIAAKSGVIKDVDEKSSVGGYPAIPIKQWHRQTIALKKLTIQDKND